MQKDKRKDYINIGYNIKKYRQEAGLTQDMFAKLLNKNISLISHYENGYINISITTLKQISKILKINIYCLLFHKDIEDLKEFAKNNNLSKEDVLSSNGFIDDELFSKDSNKL